MKNKVSLKWKIAGYLSIFTVIMLVIIALLDTRFLEPMYRRSRIEAVREAGAVIENSIEIDDIDDDELVTLIYQVAEQQNVCIRMLEDGSDFTTGYMGCRLYRMSDREVLGELAKASANGNAYMNVGDRSGFFEAPMTEIIYTRIIDEDDPLVIMINASVSPVDAAVETLKKQLLIIAGAMILGVLILVAFLNRNVIRPLTKINEAARELSHGKYQADPSTDQYREAEELNRTLTQAAEDIGKADQAKRDLIGNVSHDLRTPLTMITGYGEMMRDLPGENNEENLQVIIDEANRLSVLVNDLLDLSKLQSGRMELHPTVFDLSALVQNELRKYEIYKVRDGFAIDTEIEEAVYTEADSQRIAQVINNFMVNAVNYSDTRRKITVRVKAEGDHARVEVEDCGKGIPPEKLQDIWDRYYKIDREHVRASQGSGIGLAIVREILELHHTQYGAESEPDKGSLFWFTLPLRKEEG